MVFDEVAESGEGKVCHALQLCLLRPAWPMVAATLFAMAVQHDALVRIVKDEQAVMLWADQTEGIIRTRYADDVVGATDLQRRTAPSACM
jgi:hypothetical protein